MPVLDKIKNNAFLKQLAIKIGILAVILVIFIIATVLLNKNITASSLRIRALRENIQKLTWTSEAFSSLMRDYQILSPHLEAIRNLIPDRDRVINFNQKLSELAQSNQLEFNFVFQEEGAQPQATFVPFVLTLKGTLSNFIKFIEGLKTLPYFVDLDSFDLVGLPSQSSVNGGQVVSFSVKGKVFMENKSVPSPSPSTLPQI